LPQIPLTKHDGSVFSPTELSSNKVYMGSIRILNLQRRKQAAWKKF